MFNHIANIFSSLRNKTDKSCINHKSRTELEKYIERSHPQCVQDIDRLEREFNQQRTNMGRQDYFPIPRG